MANSRNSALGREYATIDTAPVIGAGGYWTNPVYPRRNNIRKLFFSIGDTTDDSSPSVATVKLQFQRLGDSGWNDFSNNGLAFAIGDRVQIDDTGSGVAWRAGVADNLDYVSGSITFGFDW